MSFLSVSSQASATSGTCSSSSHWSTPAPITPGYFPNVNENPLPTQSSAGQKEVLGDYVATPTRASVMAEAAAYAHRRVASVGSTSSHGEESSSPSIHQYSSALRLTMRKRYDEARRKLSEDGDKVIQDFSWEDEDPIDRHVKLAQAKAEWQAKRDADQAIASGSRVPSPEVSRAATTEIMLGRPGLAVASLDDGLPPVRPTLLDFRGFSHLLSSSYRGEAPDVDTPGSICSTGSFEGGSSEDWIDMYGRSRSGNILQSRSGTGSPTIINRMSQATISSEASTDTIMSNNTITASSSRPRSYASPSSTSCALPRSEMDTLFQPLPTPAPSSSMANGYFAIPTKSAPVPTSRSYPQRPTIGIRQKSRSHPYANVAGRQRTPSGDLLTNMSVRTPEEVDISGRTESETMILRAGLRSQRTRTVTRA
jgi:hypothetical protein